ncbi:hypothetical protein C5H21_00330 [Xylella fastidiosa]|nr:hypothetical protein C5H21_00330 [Xylella fastidiosa]
MLETMAAFYDTGKAATHYSLLLPWNALNKPHMPRLNHSYSSTATHRYTCNTLRMHGSSNTMTDHVHLFEYTDIHHPMHALMPTTHTHIATPTHPASWQQ